MKKIAIAGPGRSGTSFLVQLCDAWGFSVPSGGANWNETAQAGLESRIGGDSPFDVDKDPWAFNYIDALTDDQLAQYAVVLVPIRDLRHAAVSRSVQERFSRMASGDLDQWAWESWGGGGGRCNLRHQRLGRGERASEGFVAAAGGGKSTRPPVGHSQLSSNCRGL